MPVRRVALGDTGRRVAQNVRALRLERNLTQAELAIMAGLPSQSVTEIENGARRVDVDDLVALAHVLRVPVSTITGVE